MSYRKLELGQSSDLSTWLCRSFLPRWQAYEARCP